MPYNPNIPQPTDAISDSQNDILVNFQSINTWVQVNHTGFDSPPNTGKHTFIQMPQQAGLPATALGETALVTLASAYNTNAPTLVYRRENNGTAIEIASASLIAQGWTFLPSGLLMKWGSAVLPNVGSFNVSWPVAATIPVFGTIFNTWTQVMCTTLVPDPNVAVNVNATLTSPLLVSVRLVARDSAVATNFPVTIQFQTIGTL